jgi:putative endonuclease
MERHFLAHHVVSKRVLVYIKRARRTTNINSMWYVYIIRCSDNSLYTGVTIDVPRRLRAHNEKSGGSYTRIRTPVTLVYQESHQTQLSALKREAQIKRWSRTKKLALIKGCYKELAILAKSRD